MTDIPRWGLIAGGSGGLGSAICEALAEDGWHIALTYRSNAEAARRTAARVREIGHDCVVVRVDLTDATAVANVVELSVPVPLSGVVYAAGPYIPMRYISELPEPVPGSSPRRFGRGLQPPAACDRPAAPNSRLHGRTDHAGD